MRSVVVLCVMDRHCSDPDPDPDLTFLYDAESDGIESFLKLYCA
jgi:hypothetical protein